MRISVILFIFLISACSSVNFTIQNDVVGKTDKDFSNGTQFSYRSPKSITGIEKFIPVPRLQDTDPTDSISNVVLLEQNIYTPDDLKSSEVVPDENPYAGSLTIGEKVVKANTTRRISSQIHLGTSGKYSFAGTTQKFVHDTLTDLGRNQTHPNGWDNEIEAEPLFNFDYERSAQDFRFSKWGFDFNNERTTIVRLGNIHTAILASQGLRYGLNTPDATELNINRVNAYSFTNVFGQLQAHNLYYDGGIFRESVHTVDSKPVIYGFDLGIQVGYKSIIVKFTYSVSSKQYVGAADDFNTTGTLTFGTDW